MGVFVRNICVYGKDIGVAIRSCDIACDINDEETSEEVAGILLHDTTSV